MLVVGICRKGRGIFRVKILIWEVKVWSCCREFDLGFDEIVNRL